MIRPNTAWCRHFGPVPPTWKARLAEPVGETTEKERVQAGRELGLWCDQRRFPTPEVSEKVYDYWAETQGRKTEELSSLSQRIASRCLGEHEVEEVWNQFFELDRPLFDFLLELKSDSMMNHFAFQLVNLVEEPLADTTLSQRLETARQLLSYPEVALHDSKIRILQAYRDASHQLGPSQAKLDIQRFMQALEGRPKSTARDCLGHYSSLELMHQPRRQVYEGFLQRGYYWRWLEELTCLVADAATEVPLETRLATAGHLLDEVDGYDLRVAVYSTILTRFSQGVDWSIACDEVDRFRSCLSTPDEESFQDLVVGSLWDHPELYGQIERAGFEPPWTLTLTKAVLAPAGETTALQRWKLFEQVRPATDRVAATPGDQLGVYQGLAARLEAGLDSLSSVAQLRRLGHFLNGRLRQPSDVATVFRCFGELAPLDPDWDHFAQRLGEFDALTAVTSLAFEGEALEGYLSLRDGLPEQDPVGLALDLRRLLDRGLTPSQAVQSLLLSPAESPTDIDLTIEEDYLLIGGQQVDLAD